MTPDNKVNDLLQQMRLAVENARAANAYLPLPTGSTSRAEALISSISSEETSQPHTLILLTHELMAGIETRFGIKPSSLAQRKLVRILNDMPITAMRDWVESLKNCSPDHSEWQALAENLTVQETYFCRDPELMRMLTEDILPYLIAIRKKQKKLQVWSAASSTGEEVYDLSFCALRALQNAGLGQCVNGRFLTESGWSVHVLGTDISNQALRTAKAASYSDLGMGSFRNLPQDWRIMFEDIKTAQTHAVPRVNYFKIREWVRQCTRFERFNLMNTQPPALGMDLVFCRNVLIYFGDPAKKTVQTMLARAMSTGGVLVLGATVQMLVPEYFESRQGKGGPWYVRNDTRL